MITNPPQHRRRRGAALLGLLWSLYVLLGGAGGFTPAPSAAGRAQAASVPARACRMCPMHPGQACCCHPAPASGLRAVCTARCDLGAPAAFAAAHSWPALAPPRAGGVLRPPPPSRLARAGSLSAPTACPAPPTPPPSFS